MKFVGYLLFSIIIFTSCSTQYNIAGNSTLSTLDGRTLYLRVHQDGESLHNVDSCQVVHGQFNFVGDVDSVVVAHLCMGNDNMMPVVLENGKLAIEMNNISQRVTGGPLNNKLYKFIEEKNRLENEQWKLDQECFRMMREGKPIQDIHDSIGNKLKNLAEQIENLETKFIKENYNNALGPACFMLLFGQYPIPVITQQIQQIIDTAPERFLQDPMVNNYMKEAKLNSSKDNPSAMENEFDIAP